MSPYPHLRQAPIQEALIDIRTSLASELDMESIRARGSPEPGFPTVQHAKQLEARLNLGVETVESSVSVRGVLFRSADGLRVVQFRNDGFTFNWLRPYSTWEELAEQARRFWRHYEMVAQPRSITRVAVRYINRFPVSLPLELEEVFTVPLQLPPGFDGVIGEFLYRTTFRDGATGKWCGMTLTGESRPPDGADIIFDIDCFQSGNIDPVDPVVWDEILPSMREIKNRVFFAGLTPKTIERFK